MVKNQFLRGSEWRKWDLRAHTPLDKAWKDNEDLSTEQNKKDFAKRYIAFAKHKDYLQ